MPLYEYECEACRQRFEIIQKFSDGPPDACRKCGKGPVHRLQSSPAFQFKGSGWYVTDYAQKSRGDSSGGGKDKSASSTDAPAASSDSAPKAEVAAKTDSSTASSTASSTPAKE